jgi:thiamine biosynthesis lipoprotein
MRSRNIQPLVIIVLGFLLLSGCLGEQEHTLDGRTMGTTYHIKVVAGRFADMTAVQTKIDERLKQINQSMSTYQPTSEISRFNALADTETRFPISVDFLNVMHAAQEIYRLGKGAWDPTVDPLVNLWGFGKDGNISKMPNKEAIEKARQRVGFDAIEILFGGHLRKSKSDLSLDLASIAKGYGVDQIARLLKDEEFENFLVEIGGEVYAAGLRPNGQPWRVGINQPDKDAPSDALYAVVQLHDRAMATSGDYRNFYRFDGRTYSHIIDPRTGYPIENRVVSASVVATNCTLADGLATAMMVMGPEAGIAVLNQLPEVEGIIILRHGDGRLEPFASKGMDFQKK